MSLPNPNNEGTWTNNTAEGYPYTDIPGRPLRIVDITDYIHTNIFGGINLPTRTDDVETAINDQRVAWIRNIIVHYSGGSIGPQNANPQDGIPNRVVRVCQTIHDRGMAAMAYHFIIPYWENFIDTDLRRIIIYKVQDFKVMGSHTGLQRRSSIGINCPGSFRGYASSTGNFIVNSEGTVPSDFQIQALNELLDYLQYYYSIADAHVQGHFQHGKTVCPGYDLERWIMDRENRSRRFCYPLRVNSNYPAFLQFGGSEQMHEESPLLNENGNSDQSLNYITNNIELGQGFFPFGRHGLWHNGIHIKSYNNQSSEVYNVHDGWIIAARVVGDIEINGHNYGSPCFVLVQHCDPGLIRLGNRDRRTQWNPHSSGIEPQRMRHFYYYSLYMHLIPNELLIEEPNWLRDLEEKDELMYEQLTNNSGPFAFGNVSLPVSTGEVIGFTGQHNPFAANNRIPSEHNQLKYLLHLEIFSSLNLIAQFDPDDAKYEEWSYSYSGNNPLEDSRNLILNNIDGLDHYRDIIEEVLAQAESEDPSEINPSSVPQSNLEMNDLLSKCIVSHQSEWAIDWSHAIAQMQISENQRDELIQYYNEFQWLRIIWNDANKRQKLIEATNWLYEWRRPQARQQAVQSSGSGNLGWSTNHKFFFYHPIRFLNWLNGMRRVVVPEGIDYKRAAGYGFPNLTNNDIVGNNRTYNWQWDSRFDWDLDSNVTI